jgi:hypothetical protein
VPHEIGLEAACYWLTGGLPPPKFRWHVSALDGTVWNRRWSCLRSACLLWRTDRHCGRSVGRMHTMLSNRIHPSMWRGLCMGQESWPHEELRSGRKVGNDRRSGRRLGSHARHLRRSSPALHPSVAHPKQVRADIIERIARCQRESSGDLVFRAILPDHILALSDQRGHWTWWPPDLLCSPEVSFIDKGHASSDHSG